MQRTLSLLSIAMGISLATLLGIARLHTSIARTTSPTPLKPVASQPLSPTAAYGRLPLAFESNQGQVDKQVQFLSHGPGYNLFLTANQAVLTLHHLDTKQQSALAQHPATSPGRSPATPRARSKTPVSTTSVLRMKLLGANSDPVVSGQQKLPGIVNYFIGNDPAKWRTNVCTYGRVQYKGVYPGIDLVYYGNPHQLEYDWVVAPGADVHQIQWEVTGAQKASLTAEGDLKLHTECGDIVEHAPVIYQEVDGVRKSVAGRLVLQSIPKCPNTEYRIPELRSPNHEPRMGFEVASYDHTRPLVIDPVLVYSTYLGGSGGDYSNGIAVDSSGNAYITGYTYSTDFPTKNPIQSANNNTKGGSNAFITKLNASGSALVYSTYLGGSSAYGDSGNGIAVDSSGNAYIAGYTASIDFPLQNPLQAANKATNGNATAFVTEINSSGSALIYSTYLGGSDGENGHAIAVDGSGNAYVTGSTSSTDFPTKNPIQSQNNGDGDVFVTEINASGSALVYSTCLGGSGVDIGNGISVDGSGNAYVAGSTSSTDFPTKNPIQATYNSNGGYTAFVTEINASGSALVYSTYLGGSSEDEGYGIAVDGSGNAYVTGFTESINFPTKNPIQSTNKASNGGSNAFVTEINASGSALVYSTYLGGSSEDYGCGIAVDGSGNAYVTGFTSSTDCPVQNPLQAVNRDASGGNAFVARIGNYNWQTVDLDVGSDDNTRLLWHNTTQTLGLWSISNTGTSSNLRNYGPFTGYTAQALATGSDGYTRLLWLKNDQTAALWILNANNTFNNGFNFGPYAGWAAIDVTVGSDNNARLLWTKTDGTAGIWSVSNTGAMTNPINYGPYTGWQATRIAAGSDGYIRVLWSKTDGTAALWILNADNSYKTGFNLGPYSQTTAADISVGSDNKTRLLWTEANGQVAIWTIDNSGNITNATDFGPYKGWTATRIAAGSDGYTHLLWFKADGTQAVWLLKSDNSYDTGFSFGPY